MLQCVEVKSLRGIRALYANATRDIEVHDDDFE